MSKKLLALFLVLGLIAYAEDTNTVASDTTATESSAEENVATTEVTKQVTSENNQQLDVKENTKEAKKLYDELRKLDAKRAEKFKAYF